MGDRELESLEILKKKINSKKESVEKNVVNLNNSEKKMFNLALIWVSDIITEMIENANI